MDMTTPVAAVRGYFKKLGLESEIADIYLALHTYGPQTISALSRSSGVERTRIYRLIDALMESNLIELEAGQARGIIKAAPIANLRILIHQREQELRSLQDELELIEQTLARNSLSSPGTRVQFYYGQQGTRQMLGNELETTGEILGYTGRTLSDIAGDTFARTWVDNFVQRDLHARMLVNDINVATFGRRKAAGDTPGVHQNITYRYIAPRILRISYDCRMYGKVVAYHMRQGGDNFGMELHNQDIANTQRQFFEMLWHQAKPVGDLDSTPNT